MEKKFQDYENSIKPKHSFGFTPKYKESFSTSEKPRIFVEIASKAFESLGWDIIFKDENQIEAKRKGDFDSWTQKISAQINHQGQVFVKSESLGNEMWDIGKNCKRVKLFIYAYNETLKEFDDDKLVELEKSIEIKDNWDDYVIPDELPAPKKFIKPQFFIPLVGISLISILISYLVAVLSVEGLYIIFLFEVIIGIILGFSFKLLMKLGNYTDWNKIKLLLLVSVVLTFVMNQVFQYELMLSRYNYEPIGIVEFMKMRLENGLTIKDLNVGSIGLVISWIIQIGLTFLVGYLRTLSGLINTLIERVPGEVVEFALYHFVKGKNEISVRHELSKMGWKTELEQDMVLEAISGMQGGQELSRGN